MVWVGGSQGTLAPCLVDLFLEADRRWPGRSRASDGSLGDTAHATRDSDHNPKSPNPPGWVDAGDLTDDKASGCDADLLAHHLVASKDPRVKYVIWNGTVVRSYAKPGLPAWTPEPYTGSNPHDKHTHISVTEAGRHIRAPWFPQEDDVLNDDDKQWIRAQLGVNTDLTKVVSLLGEIQSTLKDVTGIQAGQNLLGEVQSSMKAVVAGMAGGDVDLTDDQVQAIIAALPDAVKQALREGTG